MGSSTSVATLTFSAATLAGTLLRDFNCLVFSSSSPYPSRSVTATHCRYTSKYQLYNYVILFPYQYYVHIQFF